MDMESAPCHPRRPMRSKWSGHSSSAHRHGTTSATPRVSRNKTLRVDELERQLDQDADPLVVKYYNALVDELRREDEARMHLDPQLWGLNSDFKLTKASVPRRVSNVD